MEISFADWAQDKRQVWDRMCERSGCPGAKATWDAATWQYQDWVFGRTWSATISQSKVRRYGYTGYVDSYDTFTKTFDRLRDMGQIPPSDIKANGH